MTLHDVIRFFIICIHYPALWKYGTNNM